MREWLMQANAMNPQFRPICGFQPPYEADFEAMQVILRDCIAADDLRMIFENEEVVVYQYVNQVNKLKLAQPRIRLYDIKFIAALIGYETWLIVSGLIAVNRDDQVYYQVKQAKKKLLQAMNDIWGVEVKKKGA